MAARLREHYQKKVVPALTKEFGYKNVMAVPKIEKISINIGLGEATQNAKLMDGAVNELGQIAGQKPVITKARKSIAAVQAARRHVDRLHGDAARRPHVRIFRPPGERGAAARPRFPRRVARKSLRRPRQLYAGHQGPVDLSRRSITPRWTRPRE